MCAVLSCSALVSKLATWEDPNEEAFTDGYMRSAALKIELKRAVA